MAEASYSIFEYLYRDASNYKQFGKLLLTGAIPVSALFRIMAKTDDSNLIVPSFYGIPSLAAQFDDYPTLDDHVFHEFESLRPARKDERNELPVWGSVDALLAAFDAAPYWNTTEGHELIALIVERDGLN